VELDISETPGEFRFAVRDDGRGMSPEELARATDPFVTDGAKHPGRRIGLGLPFMIQMSEQSGGGWDVRSEKGRGTVVEAWFSRASPDAPPEGDLPAMLRSVLTFSGPGEVIARRTRMGPGGRPELDYEARRSELEEAIGGLSDAGSLLLLGKYLRSLEESAGAAGA
jgi:hypothetical protein